MNFKHIKTLAALSFACLSLPAFAQNYEDDALGYSQSELIGTARIQAIGGAQVALGGDLGTFGINPAGIAFYRSSDLGITFNFKNVSNKATYLDSNTDDPFSKFTVPQFGLVIANARKENDGSFNGRWNNFAFGLSYMRTNDFNNRYSYQGYNGSSSITSFFADLAYNRYQGDELPDINDPFYLEDVAYAAGIIDDAEIDGQPTFIGLSEFGDLQQFREVETKGGISETSVTLGGNYGNQLFLGAALTYVNVRQENESYYTEYDINDPSYPFDITSFDYVRNYEQRGAGFNAKLGAVYLPVKDVRIGLSVQTPTFIKFEEDNYDEIVTLESNGESYNSSIEGTFDYDIRTPLKVNAGLAKFFGDQGFLSADVEFVDYSRIDFDSEFRDFNNDINQRVSDRFKNAVNFRVGGEYKLDAISLRLGYAYFGSPYSNTEEDFSRNYFTGGLGYRYSNVYVDLAGIYNQSTTTQVPYEAGDLSPVADIDHNKLGIMLTVGTRF
ncbi:hypothetical protein EDD80_103222 [Anseongella ginsenosidimutans]|uniref:Outer membrane protein transport protein (OMPP1/FadL/TodX) n=1 Tax=Anseongella ginsenosidimutans TaxID=496056 RepID=A0A4R3KT00_9SPHI|nr:hypothetical protein [Anseongella ginsenosidimutans]QEC53466.1 hypothetical protein FRZ59_14715 [Anseongella ginsenosidimutans]TCS88358.1 hypothetical protein EDD80_103222 [Anseongella ginsenosidimutans]